MVEQVGEDDQFPSYEVVRSQSSQGSGISLFLRKSAAPSTSHAYNQVPETSCIE